MRNTESRKSATGYFDQDSWEAKMKVAASANPWLSKVMAALGNNVECLTADFENPEIVSNFIYPH
jgi:hypothetical protein